MQSCSGLRKKVCAEANDCRWMVKKGCTTKSTACTTLKKEACDASNVCNWFKGKGCLKQGTAPAAEARMHALVKLYEEKNKKLAKDIAKIEKSKLSYKAKMEAINANLEKSISDADKKKLYKKRDSYQIKLAELSDDVKNINEKIKKNNESMTAAKNLLKKK
eukprot:762478-Hanusia_phi.AAC.18